MVLWDSASASESAGTPLIVGEGDVKGVAFSRDGKTIAAAYGGGVVLWDVACAHGWPTNPCP